MLFSLTKLKKLKGNEKLPFTGLGTIARTKTARSFFLFTPAESLPALALGLFTERATSRLRNPAPVLVLPILLAAGIASAFGSLAIRKSSYNTWQ